MKKILLLSALIIALLGGIFYIEYAARLDDDFKKAGIVIQPPFNQLEEINIDAISNLSLIALASSDTRLMGAYYYVDNRNMDDFRFFTLNIFDISYMFRDNTVWDKVYYDSYLNSTLKYVPNGSSASKKLINGAPAVLYYYQRDMGDNMFIPTKAAVICCNKKAYYLEAASIDNVDGWFDKVEQAISFKDFAVERRYSIAFMVLLSIAAAISLIFVVREVMTLIKANKLIWINKRAHNHYKYIKATIVFNIIVALILIILLTYDDEVFYFYGTMLIVETLVKNGLILLYLRKKSQQEYSEDYLVPQWFKDKFYRYLNNRAELRAILFFLYMPLFYVIPLPFGTVAIVFYIIPICLLTGAYIGFKWIKAGKKESL